MQAEKLRRVCAIVLFSLLLRFTALAGDPDSDDDTARPANGSVIQKFLQATQTHEDALRGSSMQVSIDAFIPKLKQHGTMKLLRRISKVGTITTHMLAFQGDNTVKTEVIARYLQAEQQGQGDQSVAITPVNYKFKNKGQKQTPAGQVYVFQLTPRKKLVGLFKGELWIDSKTYLPLEEKGKLVKSPSIWFKKVEFERSFIVRDGVAVPQHVEITTDVRLFGKVEMDISFSNYQPQADASEPGSPESLLWTGPALSREARDTIACLY